MDYKMPNTQYVNQVGVAVNGKISDNALLKLERYLLALLINNNQQNDGLQDLSTEAARYHLNCGGKRIRAKIAIEAANALGLSEQNSIVIAAISELLHNASLIHDDLQDGDIYRRDNEAVWAKFGKDIALCTGDLFISAAYAALAQVSNTKLIPLMINTIHHETVSAIRGQCFDVNHKINPINSLHYYQQVAIAKSGALLSLPMQLVLIASKYSQFLDTAKKATESFTIAYQIADDLSDLQNDIATTDKPSILNIVFVLKAAGHTHDVLNEAKQIALQKANKSIELAQQLPRQSGRFLAELVLKLKLSLLN